MTPEYYILIIGYIFGFYMAWNIGANDVANSMASAVGAKAITIRQAVLIAGILNVVGAVFIGSHVTNIPAIKMAWRMVIAFAPTADAMEFATSLAPMFQAM